MDNIIALGGVLGTFVTAVATIFLWRVTKILAKETTRMVEASSQPHIVATLDPNRWSMAHVDLNVTNTGNATAYNIEIQFTPALQTDKEHPLKKVSVLKPGQSISSYISEHADLKDKVYAVKISWSKTHGTIVREGNTYTLNLADYDGMSRLGNDPLVDMARHINKIQERFGDMARGSNRIKIDCYTSSDRMHEQRVSARRRRRYQQEKIGEETNSNHS